MDTEDQIKGRIIHGLNAAAYARIHYWVKGNYGKAVRCDSPTCSKKSQNFSWSNLNHKYLQDIADWMQMCRSCHAKMDMTDKSREASRKRLTDIHITEDTSDGYHTFKELYEFRKLYNAALFNTWALDGIFNIHKSKKHFDGEDCFGGGWFIVMATLPTGQISNHYELKDWDLFKCEERERADEWDGHTAQDVAKRLLNYLKLKSKLQQASIESRVIELIGEDEVLTQAEINKIIEANDYQIGEEDIRDEDGKRLKIRNEFRKELRVKLQQLEEGNE